MTDARNTLLERLKTDLIGPKTVDEIISDRPTDRYLTGILFAPKTSFSAEEDDEASDADNADGPGTALDGVKAASTFRPSSAGLSFAVQPTGDSPSLRVRIEGARYLAEGSPGNRDGPRGRRKKQWRREPHVAEFTLDLLASSAGGAPVVNLGKHGLPDVRLHSRLAPWGDVRLVTLAVTNDAIPAKARSREANEKAALFQVSLSVECAQDCQFVPKPDRSGAASANDDAKTAALLYRNVQQWAVGHTCSATWDEPVGGAIRQVRTNWFPEATVHVVSAAGDEEFQSEKVRTPLNASWIVSQDKDTVCDGLSTFVDAYASWIAKTEAQIDALPKHFGEQSALHIKQCRKAEKRMRKGISLLKTSPEVMNAFRMANASLALQYSWRVNPDPLELLWRPFQLGFALLTLNSIADAKSSDRETMDLLWFPTGGGKTEAYLLLTAFTIFLRRLRTKGDPCGAGVTTFMRYTLRLLTIQQFERAAALICACEMIRLGKAETCAARLPDHFATDAPISLGLWVGMAATPNKVDDAKKVLDDNGESSPAQLHACPCCHGPLSWSIAKDKSRVEVRCTSDACLLARVVDHLPIWTVDEDVYHEQPTLVIGTVDKYAQITRNQLTGRLFGIGTPAAPPDLIIQDELHLISGPLGSLAGLYETAVDEMCRSPSGHRAKIIGSTATIRRAEAQIKALFDRCSFQFPPPGLDHTNSGFAVEDREAPARRYVGVTTVGRSAKFTQQAVAASLLQSATDPALGDDTRDGYSTLVNYFNSLRELGGALVLMRDDVARSIRDYASRRPGEAGRSAETQIELTSRVRLSEIPRYLKDLERPWTDQDHIDIVLASNMISVGLDVPRLGLMVVNGQPKTIAEYIQATGRVGRSHSAPGLIITLFNAAKSRDRSRYETFASWHRSLYRDVEATSVTPFAPRARDRALHAPYVALIRHLVPGMSDPGVIDQHQTEVEAILEKIVERVKRIDPTEADAARKQLGKFLDDWFDHQGLKEYWHDHRDALLTSAEAAAEHGNKARFSKQKPTPNSFRTVEASTQFVLLGGMKPIGKIRRSQVLTGNGPGAIIDFRGENGAPISVVAAGLEAWDHLAIKKGLLNDQCIYHELLQTQLQVKGFRLPPVGKERAGKNKRPRLLPAYRFPDWHVCPKCNLLQRSRIWGQEIGKPELYCIACSTGRGRRAKKAYVIPVRFIVTCPAGHLQEFPWMSWPPHLETCSREKPLKLVGDGAGLKGLKVQCTECKAERNLDGALSPGALGKLRCRGRSPWLKLPAADCDQQPVAIQRAASNAYFPVIKSALDVPPFGGSFRDHLEDFWDDLTDLDDRTQLPAYVQKKIHPKWYDPAVTAEDLTAKIVILLEMLDKKAGDLRPNEHLMLCSGGPDDESFKEFKIRPQDLPPEMDGLLDHLVSVERLREVRVLKGFTRLSPVEAEDNSASVAPLSEKKLNWLPAIEVRGEGIFINFDETKVARWEAGPEVEKRAAVAHAAAERAWKEHNGGDDRPFPMTISPRFLLVHTTAHALAERLSLDSGYSTASIRERLYISPGPGGMCGLLLYTSAPDSDGTLGGLSRKGRTNELGPILLAALRNLEWCSSDPLCSSGILSLSEGSGLAACHCCTFLPETSCEHFNRHLDRGMLVGTPDQPDIGFFRSLLGKGG